MEQNKSKRYQFRISDNEINEFLSTKKNLPEYLRTLFQLDMDRKLVMLPSNQFMQLMDYYGYSNILRAFDTIIKQ